MKNELIFKIQLLRKTPIPFVDNNQRKAYNEALDDVINLIEGKPPVYRGQNTGPR